MGALLLTTVQAVLLLSAHSAGASGCPFKFAAGWEPVPDASGATRDLLMTPKTLPTQDIQQPLLQRIKSMFGKDEKSCHNNDAGAEADTVDYAAVKEDIRRLLTESKSFWPADYGHYGPQFIRMAWHCAGTYRQWDGRGGCDGGRQVLNPELSWKDNTNVIKSHQLLEPIKVKYGKALSWGDLIVLTGTVAIEDLGGPKTGFCGGRVDEPDGSESARLTDQRLWPCPVNGDCSGPMGQSVMGLIYVDPTGHLGVPDPKGAIIDDIRRTFANMGMNDSETVVLIGAHEVGKTHGACPSGAGPSPEEDPYNPYPGTCGEGPEKGKGKNAYTAGMEGPWTTEPTKWHNEYFNNLIKYDWVETKSPGGAPQWIPKAKPGAKDQTVPEGIMMMTSDVAFLHDPSYLKIVQDFAKDSKLRDAAFGAAWYKLVTRDMGPATRCKGPWVEPPGSFQNPLPEPTRAKIDYNAVRADIAKLLYGSAKSAEGAVEPDDSLMGPYYGALFSELAWRCASTHRVTDHKGGCNGAFIRWAPQKDWAINKGMDKVMQVLESVKSKYSKIAWADLIVLAGNTAIEAAAGHTPGETAADATTNRVFAAAKRTAQGLAHVGRVLTADGLGDDLAVLTGNAGTGEDNKPDAHGEQSKVSSDDDEAPALATKASHGKGGAAATVKAKRLAGVEGSAEGSVSAAELSATEELEGLVFCAYRSDATEATSKEALEALEPRTISSIIVQVQDDAEVAGLTVREAVALAGRLRSPTQQQRLGYSGSYNSNVTVDSLNNQYFIKLLKYNWQPQNSTAGVAEFKAVDEEGNEMYMTPRDVAMRFIPTFAAVIQQYASDAVLFQREFAAAWTKVMNGDRYGLPCNN